jgi:hypothetical protein
MCTASNCQSPPPSFQCGKTHSHTIWPDCRSPPETPTSTWMLKLPLVTVPISQTGMLTPLLLPQLVPFMSVPLLYLWLRYHSMDHIATCHMSQSPFYLYINQSSTWENPSWNSLVTHQVLCLLFSSVAFTALGDIGRIADWSIPTLDS